MNKKLDKVKLEIMRKLCSYIIDMNVTQEIAAKKIGITQPRLNKLLRGRVEYFSLAGLIEIAFKIGLDVKIKIK